MRVAILGGGINGFCCAVQILEHFKPSGDIEVTVISEAFSPNTTGDGSAGMWGPYLLSNTPTTKIYQWSKDMHDFLQEIWLSQDAGEAGICLLPVVRLTTSENEIDDFWKDIVYGCQTLNSKQLDTYNVAAKGGKKFTSGVQFVTYTSEPQKLLPYLMKRFQSNGGKIVQQKVHNMKNFISEHTMYDVFVNCTGLGSREILNDLKMYPVRGQVTRVKANWLYYAFLDESDVGNYIIPNVDSVVLGGTHQVDDYNTTVTAIDKDFIVEGCKEIVPGLEHAQHLFDWVGLRPGRGKLRLEIGDEGKQAGKIVLHNYGHGGSGVTLAWGCATDVLELLKNEIAKRQFVKSKL